MKKYILVCLMFSMAPATAGDTHESMDMRQVVNMPAPMKEMFLKNMRGHMESLDLIIAALAEGDLNDAAEIAEKGMGLGHGKPRQCDDEHDGSHDHSTHQHKPETHQGKAFGKFMPKEMKMMGMQLHTSADNFAAVAREGDVGDAYRSLRNISASCVACHQSFQVK